MRRHGVPETITSEGSEAEAAASRSDHREPGTALIIRQVQDLTHMVAPEHRGVKRGTRAMLRGQAWAAAHDTVVGIALRHMMKKKPLRGAAGAEGLTAADPCYALVA
jgi:transposase-like protein